MARKIIWTISAQQERKEILEYWFQINKSKSFSKKLNILLEAALKDIALTR